MKNSQKHRRRFPIRLTEAQRKVVAEVLPEFADQLRLDEANERIVSFTLDELRIMHQQAMTGVRHVGSGMKKTSLRHVQYTTAKAIKSFEGIGAIAVKERIYQFRIMLKDIKPTIWRRIQVRDCTLDKLHERIQTAMGWTNSHLHHFRINGKLYGDPWLLNQNFVPMNYTNSRLTTLSKILPRSGERFPFNYEYDFGDCWTHEVLFEGCLKAEPGQRYPLCMEGERACPPEDIGGTRAYRDFLKRIANIDEDQHNPFANWPVGVFDPEAFDPEKATKRIRRGLPDWRKMA